MAQCQNGQPGLKCKDLILNLGGQPGLKCKDLILNLGSFKILGDNKKATGLAMTSGVGGFIVHNPRLEIWIKPKNSAMLWVTNLGGWESQQNFSQSI